MIQLLKNIGRYFILLGKVFSRPEKMRIYGKRIWFEVEALGFNSISLTAIISTFIGAVVALQMAITLESPFIPKFMIGYATREVMVLEFSSIHTIPLAIEESEGIYNVPSVPLTKTACCSQSALSMNITKFSGDVE